MSSTPAIAMGLRLRLGLAVGLLITAVFAVYGVYTVQTERQIFMNELQQRGVALLRVFAIPSAVAMANADTPTLDNYVVELSRSSRDLSLLSLAVLDFEGRVVAHTAAGEFGERYRDAATRAAIASDTPLVRVIDVGGEARLLVTMPVVSGLRWGTLRAELSLEQVHAATASRRNYVLLLAATLAVTCSAIAYLVVSMFVMNVRLREANGQLERMAKTDPLTGLYNRRHFLERLQMELKRGERSAHQFSVILLDVDYFKTFNDTHGHPRGDEILRELSSLLRSNLRSTDVIARYGGEEFVILLLDTGPSEGHATALKLQHAVASHPFAHEHTQPGGTLTISAGAAFYPRDSRDGRELVQHADEALYRSKALGRNRVTRFDEMSTAPDSPRLLSV